MNPFFLTSVTSNYHGHVTLQILIAIDIANFLSTLNIVNEKCTRFPMADQISTGIVRASFEIEINRCRFEDSNLPRYRYAHGLAKCYKIPH